jgi:hypothetical protein
MKPMSFFPDEDLPIEPASDRAEPVLWIRRLVVVKDRVPDAHVIRDVAFRPGLNVIRAVERPTGDTRLIGHSVGKTLLTRLIRYCLGESHFATEPVLDRITAAFLDAYVLAEVTVSGRRWVVARPLRDAPIGSSWSVETDDWRAGLAEPSNLQRFGDFLDVVTQATVGGLPELHLPNADRPARWLDLFAWLARDQETRYQHPGEWRSPEANSGTARLHRDDASLLIRWAMGLIDAGEIRMIVERHGFLREYAEAQGEFGRLTAYLNASLDPLRARLELGDSDLPEQFFVTRARQQAEQRIQSLEGLLTEFTDEAQVDCLHGEAVATGQAVAVASQELERERGLRDAGELELRQRRESSPDDYYRTFEPRRNCPQDQCPFNPANWSDTTADPERERHIAELEAVLARHDRQIEALEEQLPILTQRHAEAELRFVTERRHREQNIDGTLRQIGRWQQLTEEIEDYAATLRRRDEAETRIARLEREIRESRERQEMARNAQEDRRRQLSRYYDWTLKRLVGPDAGGAIGLDARGLHPEPERTVAANGAALATLASVLGLDLACLTASVCGLGHHPRLLVHDSPKEADLETVLYERIFLLALELERAFGQRSPSFQYIVTTTTPPPMEVAEEHIRLVLDARDENGLLLKRWF